jgi:molybdopterin-guanine dinucleotide biosynthesis protein A
MVARAVDVLRDVSDPVVLLGGDGTLAKRLGLPWRADRRAGRGPLAGIATGLAWARELGREGLVVLACDLPLMTPEAIRAIVAAARPGLDAVVAEGDARDGVQPLCAWYGLGALPAIEATLEAGRGSARALLEELRVDRLRLTGAPGDAKVAHSEAPLLNVNTPDDLEAALRFVATEGEG